MSADIWFYFISMIMYVIGGGVWIGFAVEQFKAKHYFRFGASVMMATSMILLMTRLVFS